MLKSSDDIYLLVFLGMAGTFLLSSAIILFYVRYQKKLQQQQQQMKEAEQAYQVQILQKTIQSQEDERRRIGRDMHDDVGGSLANLRLVISKIARVETLEALKPLVMNCQGLTDDVINNVRNISHNLSPSGLELFGLADILGELCDRTLSSSGLAITLKDDAAKPVQQIDHNISIALYRVVQELLTNTIKHADAQTVCVSLDHSEKLLILDYADDGKGIEPGMLRSKGIGMYNIESRLSMIGANFTMGTPGTKGFSIHIEVPLAAA